MFRGKKQYKELITGVDIGSTAIRIAVGQQAAGVDGQTHLNIIGLVEVPSEGVHKGVVTSIEENVSSLANALEQVERLVGVPIEHAWIGISGIHILCQETRGVVAVAKSDGEISADDVERAVEAARTIAVPLNYEIIHVIPRTFNVDGQTGVKDPVGMTGIRLEVNAQIIYGASAHIKNISKVVYRTGIDIDDLVLSVLATGEVVTTSRQRELGVAVVNIGGSTTSLIVYESGEIMHIVILPIGSEHVTNDLAIGMRCPIDVAERVKLEYGQCIAKYISRKEKIQLGDVGGREGEVFSLYYISQIIEARVAELLEKVNAQFVVVGRSGRLPAGVLFTGGGSRIGGLGELAKQEFSLSAALGTPLFINSGHHAIHNIAFTTAVGLVRWGSAVHETIAPVTRTYSKTGSNVWKKIHDTWRTLIP